MIAFLDGRTTLQITQGKAWQHQSALNLVMRACLKIGGMSFWLFVLKGSWQPRLFRMGSKPTQREANQDTGYLL